MPRESLARIETQMEQLRKSMNTLARSNTTKYRAMRVPGGGVGGRESTVVVVPSTYPGAPPKEAVAGSGVSLADIDLASVVLMTAVSQELRHSEIIKGALILVRVMNHPAFLGFWMVALFASGKLLRVSDRSYQPPEVFSVARWKHLSSWSNRT